MSVTTVRLPPEIEQGLETTASKLQRSKSWVISEALREYIARNREGEARWQQTLEAMADVAQGRVVSGEAVHDWLRSWDSADEHPKPTVGQ
jgi:predicted transcriptional regulator